MQRYVHLINNTTKLDHKVLEVPFSTSISFRIHLCGKVFKIGMFAKRLQYVPLRSRFVQRVDLAHINFRLLSSTVDSSKGSLLGPKESASEGWAWIPPRTMEHLEPEGVKKRYKLPVNVG